MFDITRILLKNKFTITKVHCTCPLNVDILSVTIANACIFVLAFLHKSSTYVLNASLWSIFILSSFLHFLLFVVSYLFRLPFDHFKVHCIARINFQLSVNYLKRFFASFLFFFFTGNILYAFTTVRWCFFIFIFWKVSINYREKYIVQKMFQIIVLTALVSHAWIVHLLYLLHICCTRAIALNFLSLLS